ncbi:MAG: helix-hairpin-helix domain-containing protein [Coriobacteriales bacterium]|jgi:competence protein ComEA|nr:helix-hairpin-helix domain-containing protein [Coriobacteriales bacterium]
MATRGGVLEGLEKLALIESLSTRLKVSPRVVAYGLSAFAVLIAALVFWLCVVQPGWNHEEIAQPQGSRALEHPSTEFDSTATSPIVDTQVTSASQLIVVYVTGAVLNPGLYTIAGNSRVGDAVQAAGGLTTEAASATVNLAQKVQDGAQIHIPRIDEVASNAPNAGVANTPEQPTAGPSAPALVNINTADSATLQTLNGIGPATAQKIIDYRTAHGAFSTKEELKQVSGIGEKKYAAIEALITV